MNFRVYLERNTGGGGVTSTGVTYTNLTPTPAAIGGISAGETFVEQTMQQMWDRLLYPELFPTLIPPSATFVMSITGLREIGEILNLTFQATFNRGAITPAYGTSGYRSGLPYEYTYTGTGIGGTYPSTALIDNRTLNNYIVLLGNNTWTSRVSYDAGEQPLSSKGNPYDSPLPSGTTTNIAQTIIGVYPFFGTTVVINTLTKQPLAVHNSTYWQLNMVGESDTEKQTADFPDAFSTITGVQFYNTVSSQWEWIGGSKAASLTYWNVTNIQRNINGTLVDYNRWTHNGTKVGARQLRFYTT